MILLDTHVWVWWVSEPERLSAEALRAIDEARSDRVLAVSSISTWEVALLVSKGRLALSLDVADWIAKSEALPFLRFLPVDNTVALTAVNLPGELHPDPADRIIVATALQRKARLVTKDDRLRRYPYVTTVG